MIKQGDIVRSNGRIATQQDGRRRYIEFEGALVLEADGKEITVSPIGKTAVLICQKGDLHVATAATAPAQTGTLPVSGTLTNAAPEPQESPQEPEPAPEAPKPSLSALKKPDEPKRRPQAKKPAARRRRRT